VDAHITRIQDTIDEDQYKKIASNIGPDIIPQEIPAELKTVKQKIALIENNTIPDMRKEFEI
jgi:flagellar basal body P-ring protein FlgI